MKRFSLPFWPTARRGWLSLALSTAAVLMTLSALAVTQPAVAQRARAAGSNAPDFSAVTATGETLRLAAYRGRPVVLNFFSTACPVSAAVVGNLNRLQVERPDVVVLSINLNGATPAAIEAWGEQHGVRYPLIVDLNRRIADLYRPYATPFWVFIQPDGRIAAVRLGEHAAHNLAARVNEYLPPAVTVARLHGQ